jgi:hypothetical protein
VSDHPTADPDEWSRPLFTPGGGDAFVYFVVFGADGDLLEISTDEHRVDEVPDGVDAHELGPDWVQSFFDEPMGGQLRARDPDTAAESERAESCIVVTGTVADPPTLDYLRNVIGIATAALDTGGIGVLSLQTLDLFDPDRWRTEVFDGGAALAHRLVALLVSAEDDRDEDDGDQPGDAADGREPSTLWVHTRGLRVFGRPDLSIRGVAPLDLELVNQLVNALVAQLARGLVIDDGMTMDIGGDVGALRFDRRGHVDDPDFNNEHLEITRG